jgi:hypothetical protein
MRWWIAVVAGVIGVTSLDSGSTQVMPDGLRRNPLQQLGQLPRSEDAIQWVLAAAAHEPGVLDAPATRIGGWSMNRIADALHDVTRLKHSEAYNAVLARAAMLHADLSLLRRGDGLPPPPRDSRYTSPLFLDGRRIGVSGRDEQLAFARTVIAAMRPPGGDGRAVQWYRAIGADLAARYWLLDLAQHNEDARRLFPGSAGILFDAGCEAEAITAPRVQVAVAATVRPSSGPLRPPAGADRLTVGFNLERAAGFYRDALALDPTMTEARVRLGHVLLRQRQFNAAAETLAGPPQTADQMVRYFAAMIRGRLSEQTKHPQEARQSYIEAGQLYPAAQSPLLALAALEREQGDDAAATAPMQRLAGLTTTDRLRDDPWWLYFECNGRNAIGELARLRYAFRTGEAK